MDLACPQVEGLLQFVALLFQKSANGLSMISLDVQVAVLYRATRSACRFELFQQSGVIIVGGQSANDGHGFPSFPFFDSDYNGLLFGGSSHNFWRWTCAVALQFFANLAAKRPVKWSSFKESHHEDFRFEDSKTGNFARHFENG